MYILLFLWLLVFAGFAAAFLLLSRAKKYSPEKVKNAKKYVTVNTVLFTAVCLYMFVLFCVISHFELADASLPNAFSDSIKKAAQEKWFIAIFPVGYFFYSRLYASQKTQNKR